MDTFDVAIVGGGIIGCAVARQLARYELSVAVLEAANDIATATTKANGGLVHAGYDPKPDTMKAYVNARGCELYTRWAAELGFEFHRPGSMVLGFDEADRVALKRLLKRGRMNGVTALEIVHGSRIRELEPRASAAATCALWCPSTGYVDPFAVAIACAELACANGTIFMRGARVLAIRRSAGRFEIETSAGAVGSRMIVNAAGNDAADVARMAGAEKFHLIWRQGNIVVLDKEPCALMPLYPVPGAVSKGVIVTGTVHRNTIITATAAVRAPGDLDTYAADVETLLAGARRLVPDLDTGRVIRTFAGGRAVIEGGDDFLIAASARAPGLVFAAGIQSPGVASAPAIAERVVALLREAGLSLTERIGGVRRRSAPRDFDVEPLAVQRELVASDRSWGQIVCRCETVPEAEVVEAIRRTPGAVSVEGVKRRCRAGMGRCQGGFCQSRTVRILARELGVKPWEVPLEGDSSATVLGRVKKGR